MKRHWKFIGLPLAFACIASACGSEPTEYSFRELEDEVEYVLELITSRELSDEEITRATREYYLLFDNDCGQSCVDAVKANRDRVEPMRTNPGGPLDILARQYYSYTLYFSPTQAGSFIQQLTNEFDPIRIVDAKSKRIMTHRDIVGVLNIKRFLSTDGPPETKKFSEAQIDAEVSMYQQRFVDGFFKLPYRTGFAAELWAGLEQNWSTFSGAEKRELRAFLADKDGKTTMAVSTFQRLLNINEVDAADWKATFTREQQYARLEYISYISMMGAAARISNESEAFWRW